MMRKIISAVALTALVFSTVSCNDNDNDNGLDRTKERTWNVQLLNHVYDTSNDNSSTAASASINDQKIVYRFSTDMSKLSFTPTIETTLGGIPQQFSWTGVNASNSEEKANIYTFATDAPVSGLSNFTGQIDLIDQNIYWSYTATSPQKIVYKVISTLPTISTSTSTVTTSVWSDTTATHQLPMSSFAINPSKMTATFTISRYTDVKIPRTYMSIVAGNATLAITPKGYRITGTGLAAVGTYVTSASTKYQTAKITIDNLDATIDLENNSIHATFNMLGAKVTVSGTISI